MPDQRQKRIPVGLPRSTTGVSSDASPPIDTASDHWRKSVRTPRFDTDYPHTDTTWPDSEVNIEKLCAGTHDDVAAEDPQGQRHPDAGIGSLVHHSRSFGTNTSNSGASPPGRCRAGEPQQGDNHARSGRRRRRQEGDRETMGQPGGSDLTPTCVCVPGSSWSPTPRSWIAWPPRVLLRLAAWWGRVPMRRPPPWGGTPPSHRSSPGRRKARDLSRPGRKRRQENHPRSFRWTEIWLKYTAARGQEHADGQHGSDADLRHQRLRRAGSHDDRPGDARGSRCRF